MTNCSVSECDRPAVARGMCPKHWKRWRRNGDPIVEVPRARKSLEERFWSKVAKGGGCWEWTRYREPDWGYGIFRAVPGESMQKAHRVSWEIAHGPIPEGMQVCHRCDNPPCVRPDHLFLGTHLDNMRDRNAKGRQSRDGSTPGENSTSAKLTDEQVKDIRDRYLAGGVLQQDLAAEYNISQTQISRIVRGVRRADTMTGKARTFESRRGRGQRRALTAEQEGCIRERRAAGETRRSLADEYGVSMSLISLTTRRQPL